MHTGWIHSSTFLPYTGEPIEFQLEDRKQPIHGTFANGLFQSRWADYTADRVQSWRGAGADAAHEALAAAPVIPGRHWWMRLKGMAGFHAATDVTTAVASHARKPSGLALPLAAAIVPGTDLPL